MRWCTNEAMFNDRITRAAFLISLSAHLLLLGTPGFNVNSPHFIKPEEITVQIEIEKPPLLPRIDVMGEEKKLKSDPRPETRDHRPEDFSLKSDVVEVIDPAQEAMLRYQDMVKQRIEEVRRYPSRARRQGIEGTVYISFVVLSNGASRDIKIIRSSGSKILDKEAVATIKRANPFPPMPQELNEALNPMGVFIVFNME